MWRERSTENSTPSLDSVLHAVSCSISQSMPLSFLCFKYHCWTYHLHRSCRSAAALSHYGCHLTTMIRLVLHGAARCTHCYIPAMRDLFYHFIRVWRTRTRRRWERWGKRSWGYEQRRRSNRNLSLVNSADASQQQGPRFKSWSDSMSRFTSYCPKASIKWLCSSLRGNCETHINLTQTLVQTKIAQVIN